MPPPCLPAAPPIHPFRRPRATPATLALVSLVAACATPEDPRTILESHLSHGFGVSPFDDPLSQDSAHAALLVAAAPGAAEAALVALQTDSGRARVARLLERGLLLRNGDTLRPAFPVLTGPRAEAYYELVEAAGRQVLTAFSPQLDGLLEELDRRGWSEWRYHFLWSQLLDSQFAWAEMVGRGLVPPLTALVAWVVHPEHPWKTGTNYVPEEPSTAFMAITWTPGGSSLSRLYDDWRPVYESALAGRPVSPAAGARLTELGLLTGDGSVAIPVVLADDPLYARLRELTGHLLELVSEAMPTEELHTLTGLEPRLVFAMAYHDVGWEVLRLAEESGRVAPPPIHGSDMRGAAAVIGAYPPFLRLFD